MPVDTGPDAFLSRGADLADLVARLGLADDVVAPRAGGAFIWSRGRLRPIPQGGAFGIPDRVLPVLRSRLLSPVGVLRAGMDFVKPRTTLGSDPTVADVVRPRLGHEVVDRIVQPLLGGVHAGSVDRLSARSTVPDVLELACSSRSLVLALRRRRRAAPKPTAPPAPPLVSLRGGLSRLVGALVDAVGEDRVVRGRPVTAVRRTGAGWEVVTTEASVVARHVVLATPAHASAELVAATRPRARRRAAGDRVRRRRHRDAVARPRRGRRARGHRLPRATGRGHPPGRLHLAHEQVAPARRRRPGAAALHGRS